MIDDVQEIILGCLSGNETAWSAFFAEYAPIAMNILGRKPGNLSLEEKEDIIQNTFSRLLNGGLKNFRGSNKYEFLAYFRKIATNEAFSYLKSGKERDDAVSLDQGRTPGKAEFWPPGVHDGNREPYDGAAKREQLRIIETVLEGLPVETKQVVLMKIEGYKDREIADILGLSPGTVASRYARVKERVKKLLGQTMSE
jgi:RNA polymerase sigma factor (sigma-70 family)